MDASGQNDSFPRSGSIDRSEPALQLAPEPEAQLLTGQATSKGGETTSAGTLQFNNRRLTAYLEEAAHRQIEDQASDQQGSYQNDRRLSKE